MSCPQQFTGFTFLLPPLTLTSHPQPHSNSWSHRESTYATWLKGNIYIPYRSPAKHPLFCLTHVLLAFRLGGWQTATAVHMHLPITASLPPSTLTRSKWCFWRLQIPSFPCRITVSKCSQIKGNPDLPAIRGRQYTILQESKRKKIQSVCREHGKVVG